MAEPKEPIGADDDMELELGRRLSVLSQEYREAAERISAKKPEVQPYGWVELSLFRMLRGHAKCQESLRLKMEDLFRNVAVLAAMLRRAFDDRQFIALIDQSEPHRNYLLADDETWGSYSSVYALKEALMRSGDWEEYSAGELLAGALADHFLPGLPLEAFARVLEVNAEHVQAQAESMLPEIKRLQAEFSTRMFEAVEQGILPVSRESVQAKLDHVRITVSDSAEREVEGLHGSFSDSELLITISAGATPEELEKLVYHEMLHAISGRLARSSPEGLMEHGMSHERIGLHFSLLRKDMRIVERYRWLNEAVTESLGLDLAGGADQGIYVRERFLLEHILEGGKMQIDRRTVLTAYFEDYGPDAEHRPVAGWQAFGRAVAEAHGTGFLTMIDERILQHGLNEAIRQLDSDGSRFRAFIKERGLIQALSSRRLHSLLKQAMGTKL